MSKLRFFIALWLAKLSQPVLKITKHNGTNFPGELALKICPEFLRYIAKPKRIITVTGTNGKTTVNNLICDALEMDGTRILNNRAGSNINSGVATSLINGVTIFNRERFETAVLEVDERSSKKIYPFVQPDYTVITNLFRDSIMRNAHPEFIAGILSESFPAKTKLILNADDLISVGVAPQNPRAYYGIERMDTDVAECHNLIRDIRICPECSTELKYDYLRYHHIGKAYCPKCGFKSPDYDYAGAEVDVKNMRIKVKDARGEGTYKLLSDSVFNIYNVVTLVAVLRELGFEHEEIEKRVEKLEIVKSRYNEETAGKNRVIMQMAKDRNALACSRAFDYVQSREGEKELLLMMNNLNDERGWSENTCWLYDCDFELLNRENILHIICTGPRALDYRLRLLLAGVPEEKIDCEKDELTAAEKLWHKPGTDIYMFYGTDTVPLAMRVKAKIKAICEEAAK